jgi:translation initiation factor 1
VIVRHSENNRENTRLVYTTGIGRREACERCGAPIEDCRCSSPSRRAGRTDGIVRIALDKRRRRGKMMTSVSGAPGDDAAIAQMCRELKKALATGGAVIGGQIELQGDHRERVAAYFAARGVKTKRVGG